VSLLLVGYAGVTQFFPGVVLGLFSKRASMRGVFAGMVIGVLIVVLLMLSKHDPFMGLNAGFIALCCNFAVVGAVSLLAPVARGEIDEQPPASIEA
jgi:SSS family solute:Na+ symporter